MLKEFSKDLKNQREKKDISLEDIAAQSRLSITIFEKFESGDFSFEPEIYIRAFLKQYVKAVELNEDEVLKDYDLAKTGKYTPKVLEEKAEEVVEVVDEKPVEEAGEKIDTKKEIEKLSKEERDKKADPDFKSEGKELNKNKLKEAAIIKDRNKDSVISKAEEKRQEREEGKKEEGKDEEGKDEEKKTGFRKIKEDDDSTKPERKKEMEKREADSLRLHSAGGFKKEKAISNKKEPGYSNGSGGRFSPTVLKKIGVIFIFLTILAGLYFLVYALFFDGTGKDEPEIVRQNFNDVVAESEKKILGKRTEQEIQDSIKAAEEEQRRLLEANLDTMTLVITSKGRGSIIIIEDSTGFSNPERITFGRNETGIWKATKFFHVSSPNTNSFTAELNGKKINFGKRKVDNYLLNRESVAGEKGSDRQSTDTGETNQNTNNRKPTSTQEPKIVKPKKTEEVEEQPPVSEDEEKKDDKEDDKKDEKKDEEELKKEEEAVPEKQPGETDAENGN